MADVRKATEAILCAQAAVEALHAEFMQMGFPSKITIVVRREDRPAALVATTEDNLRDAHACLGRHLDALDPQPGGTPALDLSWLDKRR